MSAASRDWCFANGKRIKNIIFLACGSFNPPHAGHLKMFSLAKKFIESKFTCRVVEGILSPVADTFGKLNLAPAIHRLQMSKLAAESFDEFPLQADGWECAKPEWTRTVCVLRHHEEELRKRYSDFKLVFLCGVDTFHSWLRVLPSGERLWSNQHLKEIIEDYGVMVINRDFSPEMIRKIREDLLTELNIRTEIFDNNVLVVEEVDLRTNELSSTQIRETLQGHDTSLLNGLLPSSVIDYISSHSLYKIQDI